MTIILYQLELKLIDPGALKASNSSKQLEQKIKLSPWPYREEMQAVYWAESSFGRPGGNIWIHHNPIWFRWKKTLIPNGRRCLISTFMIIIFFVLSIFFICYFDLLYILMLCNKDPLQLQLFCSTFFYKKKSIKFIWGI